MANFTALEETITGLFGVIDVLIQEVVDLITGNLLVLAIVGAVLGFIVGTIALLLNMVKKTTQGSVKGTNMRK